MKNRRLHYLLLVSASVLTLTVTGAQAEEKPIVIGAVVAESGFMSQYDIPAWMRRSSPSTISMRASLPFLERASPAFLAAR